MGKKKVVEEKEEAAKVETPEPELEAAVEESTEVEPEPVEEAFTYTFEGVLTAVKSVSKKGDIAKVLTIQSRHMKQLATIDERLDQVFTITLKMGWLPPTVERPKEGDKEPELPFDPPDEKPEVETPPEPPASPEPPEAGPGEGNAPDNIDAPADAESGETETTLGADAGGEDAPPEQEPEQATELETEEKQTAYKCAKCQSPLFFDPEQPEYLFCRAEGCGQAYNLPANFVPPA